MSKALKQIEENLNLMKSRAIKAEKENKKLKQQLNSMNMDYINQEREAIREKTKYITQILEQTAKESSESILTLVKNSKNIKLIFEMLSNLERIIPENS